MLVPRARRPFWLYVAVDGSHIGTDGQWHRANTGMIYRAVPDGAGQNGPGPKRYASAQNPAEVLRGWLVAAHCGVYRPWVVLVSGD